MEAQAVVRLHPSEDTLANMSTGVNEEKSVSQQPAQGSFIMLCNYSQHSKSRQWPKQKSRVGSEQGLAAPCHSDITQKEEDQPEVTTSSTILNP